jgi:hypothetical protein
LPGTGLPTFDAAARGAQAEQAFEELGAARAHEAREAEDLAGAHLEARVLRPAGHAEAAHAHGGRVGRDDERRRGGYRSASSRPTIRLAIWWRVTSGVARARDERPSRITITSSVTCSTSSSLCEM